MVDFAEASALAPLSEGRFAWQVPDGWQQGKGAFGGLVLGTLARAAELCQPERARRLRVLTGELCAPMLPGAAELTARVVRRGGNATFVEVRAEQGGEPIARATALFGAARPPSALRLRQAAPSPPPVEALALLPMGQPPTPRFASHFEMRTPGPLPFCGGTEPVARGYVQHRGVEQLDAAAVIALVDAWWPCALAVEPGPRAMATVTFTVELLVDPGELSAATPLWHQAEVAGESDGYSVELRQLWQDGRLVALNQQVFVAL